MFLADLPDDDGGGGGGMVMILGLERLRGRSGHH